MLRIAIFFFLPLTLSPLLLIPVHAATEELPPPEAYVSGRIPDFGHEWWVKAPHSIVTSQRDGNWSDPNMWNPAQVPNVNSVVQIRHHVVFDASSAEAAAVVIYPPDSVNPAGGKLSFRSDIHTSLRLVHFLVQKGGVLEIGTVETPIQPQVKATIIFRDRAINTSDATQSFFDPAQYGNGLLAFGKVMIHGSPKTPTFVRTSAEPLRGQSSLSFTQSVSGWRADDRVVIPDTRHLLTSENWEDYSPQWETQTLQSVAGTNLSLNNGLAFDHVGARDGNGQLDFLPHVGNLSRNVIFRSESLTETGKASYCTEGNKLTDAANCVTRGHTFFTERAEVEVFYAEFRNLGRTTNASLSDTDLDSSGNPTQIGSNQRARHPVYANELLGPNPPTDPDYQYKFVGNAIVDSYKWPLAIRYSHYGLIKDNVVCNGTGAGIVAQTGNESLNVFDHNFVVAMRGNENPKDQDGRDGSLFWFNGFNHIVRNNVASTAHSTRQGFVTGSAYELGWEDVRSANTRIPLFRGADTDVSGEYRLVDMQLMPIVEFSNNEAYGAMSTGLVLWHLGSDGYNSRPIAESRIENFKVWHMFSEGVFGYPIHNVKFDGLVVRGHTRAIRPNNFSRGFRCGDYWCANITIENADVQGAGQAFGNSSNTPGVLTIQNSYFRNYSSNIAVETLATPGNRANKQPRKTIVRNVKFDAWPGSALRTVAMETQYDSGSDFIQSDQVFVLAHNQNSNDNFQLYYQAQHPLYVVPQTTYYDRDLDGIRDDVDNRGSPEVGLTNQQNWDKYFPNGTLKTDPSAQGLAMAGAIAPCLPSDPLGTCSTALTKPEVSGFAFPIVDDVTPPTIPQNLIATPISQSQIDLSWNTASDPESGVSHYKIFRNGNFLRQTAGLSLSDTSLSEATSYSYEVLAVNVMGLASAKSAAVSAQTMTDTVKPTILSVAPQSVGTKVSVIFSENVEKASAENIANYAIDNGVAITAATLNIDLKTVTLTTSILSGEIVYTLTVNNVKDRARTPNTIAPNSTGLFTFSASGPVNSSPSINAGPDQTVSLSAGAQLNSSATDDGLPTPPSLTILWSQTSGPGMVTFDNAALLDTTARFSSEGVYVLRLTVFDGELTSTDEVAITVTLSGSTQTDIPKFKNILNPAKGEMVSLPVTGEATVDIYTKNGSLVRHLKGDGSGSIEWDGRNEKGEIVSSGVYLWKIKLSNNGDKTETRKVVVLK